jgi:hypothetical protein
MAWVWKQVNEDGTALGVCESGTPEGRCLLGGEVFTGRHAHELDAECFPDVVTIPLPELVA